MSVIRSRCVGWRARRPRCCRTIDACPPPADDARVSPRAHGSPAPHLLLARASQEMASNIKKSFESIYANRHVFRARARLRSSFAAPPKRLRSLRAAGLPRTHARATTRGAACVPLLRCPPSPRAAATAPRPPCPSARAGTCSSGATSAAMSVTRRRNSSTSTSVRWASSSSRRHSVGEDASEGREPTSTPGGGKGGGWRGGRTPRAARSRWATPPSSRARPVCAPATRRARACSRSRSASGD